MASIRWTKTIWRIWSTIQYMSVGKILCMRCHNHNNTIVTTMECLPPNSNSSTVMNWRRRHRHCHRKTAATMMRHKIRPCWYRKTQRRLSRDLFHKQCIERWQQPAAVPQIWNAVKQCVPVASRIPKISHSDADLWLSKQEQ